MKVEPIDVTFGVTVAAVLFAIYFGMRAVERVRDELRMLRAERDWALDQLRAEADTVIPYGAIHRRSSE